MGMEAEKNRPTETAGVGGKRAAEEPVGLHEAAAIGQSVNMVKWMRCSPSFSLPHQEKI